MGERPTHPVSQSSPVSCDSSLENIPSSQLKQIYGEIATLSMNEHASVVSWVLWFGNETLESNSVPSQIHNTH